MKELDEIFNGYADRDKTLKQAKSEIIQWALSKLPKRAIACNCGYNYGNNIKNKEQCLFCSYIEGQHNTITQTEENIKGE